MLRKEYKIALLLLTILLISIPSALPVQNHHQTHLMNFFENYNPTASPLVTASFASAAELDDLVANNLTAESSPGKEIIQLASQPYTFYLAEKTKEIKNAISSLQQDTYSKFGLFVLIFLMWFCQAIVLIKED